MTLWYVHPAKHACFPAYKMQNWPLWKRDVILLILSLISVFATALGPILAANTITLSLHYERPFTEVALLTGYFLLGVGVAGILFVASARIWGKRHLFLLGTVLLIGSSAWGGASSGNYSSLLWSRIIQGVGTAPFEALVNATVGDLYFVHVRSVDFRRCWMKAYLDLTGAWQAYGSDEFGGLWWGLLHSYPRWQDYTHNWLVVVVLLCLDLLRLLSARYNLLLARDRVSSVCSF